MEQLELTAALAAEPPAARRAAADRRAAQAVGGAREPLALSAAAGSGKTSVLVERFVRAVREDGIAPARILAITFTERAAGELRARVRGAPARARRPRGRARHRGGVRRHLPRLLRAPAARPPAARRARPRLRGPRRGPRRRGCASGPSRPRSREFLARRAAEAVDLLAAYGVDRVARDDRAASTRELRSRGQRRPRLPVAPRGPEAGDADADALAAGRAARRAAGALRAALRASSSARARAVDFDDLELLAGRAARRATRRCAAPGRSASSC